MQLFRFKGRVLGIKEDTYRKGGRTALLLIDLEDPSLEYKLTVNLPGEPLEPNHVFVKTWSENAAVARVALDSKLFRDTGRRVATGFVEAQVWERTPEECCDCGGTGILGCPVNTSCCGDGNDKGVDLKDPWEIFERCDTCSFFKGDDVAAALLYDEWRVIRCEPDRFHHTAVNTETKKCV
jgi:hypothetical protein